MKTINERLFETSTKELKVLNASSFPDNSCVYVKNEKTGEFAYIINLEKGEYKTFSLRSTVQNAETYNYSIFH